MASGKLHLRNTKAAKLTPDLVQEIRILYGQGHSQGSLAREFGISVVQVGRIVRRESWQSLPQVQTQAEKDAMLERLLAVQREVHGTASEEMTAAIAAERDRQGRGDRMLGEAAEAKDDASAVPPSPLDE